MKNTSEILLLLKLLDKYMEGAYTYRILNIVNGNRLQVNINEDCNNCYTLSLDFVNGEFRVFNEDGFDCIEDFIDETGGFDQYLKDREDYKKKSLRNTVFKNIGKLAFYNY